MSVDVGAHSGGLWNGAAAATASHGIHGINRYCYYLSPSSYLGSFTRTMINILNILQGTWMGLLSASGSLARVSGPLFVGWIYREYGTYWTMGLPLLGLVVGLVLMIFAYKRLIPYVQRISEQQTNSVSADNNRL